MAISVCSACHESFASLGSFDKQSLLGSFLQRDFGEYRWGPFFVASNAHIPHSTACHYLNGAFCGATRNGPESQYRGNVIAELLSLSLHVSTDVLD
jgi:hypothetical protein